MATFTDTTNGYVYSIAEALKTALSQSAEVQSWLDLTPPDEATALASIVSFADVHPADLEEYTSVERAMQMPRVMIEVAQDQQPVTRKHSPGAYRSSGALEVLMERALTAQEKSIPAILESNLWKSYGRVSDELWQATQTGGDVMVIESIELLTLGRTDEDDQHVRGPLALLAMLCTWGPGQ